MPGKGKPFLAGNPDGHAGCPPGALNQTTKAARDFAQRLLNDPEYQGFVRERLALGRGRGLDGQRQHGQQGAHLSTSSMLATAMG